METLKEYKVVDLGAIRAPHSEGSFVKLLNEEIRELELADMIRDMLAAHTQSRQFDLPMMVATIEDMAKYLYDNKKYRKSVKETTIVLDKTNYEKLINHSADDIVVITKDEFRSMIKTDKEATEYGQQCWNDGVALGAKEAAEKILRSLMDKYIKREDLNDNGYGADESITMNDLLELAEQFNVEI